MNNHTEGEPGLTSHIHSQTSRHKSRATRIKFQSALSDKLRKTFYSLLMSDINLTLAIDVFSGVKLPVQYEVFIHLCCKDLLPTELTELLIRFVLKERNFTSYSHYEVFPLQAKVLRSSVSHMIANMAIMINIQSDTNTYSELCDDSVMTGMLIAMCAMQAYGLYGYEIGITETGMEVMEILTLLIQLFKNKIRVDSDHKNARICVFKCCMAFRKYFTIFELHYFSHVFRDVNLDKEDIATNIYEWQSVVCGCLLFEQMDILPSFSNGVRRNLPSTMLGVIFKASSIGIWNLWLQNDISVFASSDWEESVIAFKHAVHYLISKSSCDESIHESYHFSLPHFNLFSEMCDNLAGQHATLLHLDHNTITRFLIKKRNQ